MEGKKNIPVCFMEVQTASIMATKNELQSVEPSPTLTLMPQDEIQDIDTHLPNWHDNSKPMPSHQENFPCQLSGPFSPGSQSFIHIFHIEKPIQMQNTASDDIDMSAQLSSCDGDKGSDSHGISDSNSEDGESDKEEEINNDTIQDMNMDVKSDSAGTGQVDAEFMPSLDAGMCLDTSK